MENMRSFECTRGGGEPPPHGCEMQGRAMHQKAHRLVSVEVGVSFSMFCWLLDFTHGGEEMELNLLA